MPTSQPIVVLDFGSQYTQLIARRIREMQVYAVIVPCNIPFDNLVRMSPQALILSGGPSSVYDPSSPVCDERVLKLNLPVLGICYGLQWMSQKLGGKVEPAAGANTALPNLHPAVVAIAGGLSFTPQGLEQPRRPRGGGSAGLCDYRPDPERHFRHREP